MHIDDETKRQLQIEQCLCGKWYGLEYSLEGGFGCKETDLEVNNIITELFSKYEYLGCGRNRIVFKLKSGNYVLKFPVNNAGVSNNDWEGSVCGSTEPNNPDVTQYAKTRWIQFRGFICCVMEIVKPINDETNLPEWIHHIDSCQVGLTRKNKLVAYDFGEYN